MSRAELQKKYAEQFQTVNRSPRSAFAETIVELAEPNHLSLDIFSAYLPVRTLKEGDSLTRRVRKGKYKVYKMVPGTTHLTSERTWQQQTTYNLDDLIAGVRHNVLELESGDVGTVEEMRRELRADIMDEVVSRIFSMFNSVWNPINTPNNYLDVSGSGISPTALDTMVENVTREVGAVRAIAGTREALLPVYKFAGIREFVLSGTSTDRAAFPTAAFEEFYRTGKVTSYYGVPIVEVPNIRRHRLPGYNDRLIDTTRIQVIGEDVGEAILYGDFKEQDYYDPRVQPAEYTLHVWRKFGVMLDQVEGLGIIKVA